MNKVDKSRRQFLLAAGLGAAGAAAGALKPAAAQAEPADQPKEPRGQGYRLTEHIRKYYDTTRL
ncbi:MAG: twin-arginine translocation signal domain-containing protein [Pseudomonadota bacterium]|nr:twin-arginine translocation signal domain-containing protein [Pseudomonadota bacterium]